MGLVRQHRLHCAGHTGLSHRPDLVVRFGRGQELSRSLRRSLQAVLV